MLTIPDSGKRYYWLKLQEDFFKSKRIKKLRKIAGGDTYTIIYLKMQLLAMKRGGVLEYTGLEPTFADELALDLDEEPENVKVTIGFLLSCGLLETSDDREYFVPYAVLNTGSECASAKRVREHRGRKSLQEFPEEPNKALPGNADVTPMKRIGNGEKEIEKEIEIEGEIEEEKRDINKCSLSETSLSDGADSFEKSVRPPKIYPHDHDAYQAARFLGEWVVKNHPYLKTPCEDDLQRWAKDIDKIHRLDKRDWDEVSDVLLFSQKDPFWCKNIRSGVKFREKYDTLLVRMHERGESASARRK